MSAHYLMPATYVAPQTMTQMTQMHWTLNKSTKKNRRPRPSQKLRNGIMATGGFVRTCESNTTPEKAPISLGA